MGRRPARSGRFGLGGCPRERVGSRPADAAVFGAPGGGLRSGSCSLRDIAPAPGRTDAALGRYVPVSLLHASARPPVAPGRARRLVAGLALCAGLLAPAVAGAAPTCLDAAGTTVRCEAPNALPVGVSPAADVEDAREDAIPLPSPQILFGLVCVLGGLFALIGLMPDFDGWGPGEHEGRGKRRE